MKDALMPLTAGRFILLLLLAFQFAWSQVSPGWGFWNTDDGLTESYTSSAVSGSGGRVWIKHGNISGMNVLDGYTMAGAPDLGSTGKLQSAPDGTLWIWGGRRLSRFHDSRWISFDVDAVTSAGVIRSDSEQRWAITLNQAPFLRAPISVVAVDNNHALILLPDRILEFDAALGATRIVLSSSQTRLASFLLMRQGASGSVWVTGRQGLGRLLPGSLRWQEAVRPAAAFSDFTEPFEGEDGEVFVSATAGPSRAAILHLQGSRWQEIYRGASLNMRGWRGNDHTVWIQDGNRLLHLGATGKLMAVERGGPLSGILLWVQPEGSGNFWIGSSQGLAVYRSPLWRTPSETAEIDEVINAMTEDREGRIWFLGSHTLIGFDNRRWEFFPLPDGETAASFTADGLGSISNGAVAIRTNSSNLLLFDPKQRRFRNIKHPSGRDIHVFFQQADGSLLVETVAPSTPGDLALETYDGKEFRTLLSPGAAWGVSDLRAALPGEAGEFWIGGSNSFGVYRNGKYQRIGTAEGFTDNGVFSMQRTRDGKLLAGGRDGLFEYDRGKWLLLRNKLDRARSIAADRNGSLWVASGTGVHRLKDGSWISYGMEEGLPSSVAYRVFEDSRGRIWAGTTRGLALYHPEADPDPPATRIPGDQNMRDVPPGGRVHLVFSAVDKWKFTASDRLLFSWRMDNGPWSPFTAATSADFEHLAGGTHQFQVRAMDRNGNIDPNPAAHSFAVLLPWYHTAGFHWVAGISAVVIVFLVSLALSSYSQRGKLIGALWRRKKLEADRQEILEMVARREPLAVILQRIAGAVSAEFPGAFGCVIHTSGPTPAVFAEPGIPERLRQAMERWMFDRDGWKRVWRDLDDLTLEDGPSAPIKAGEESLGMVLAIVPKGSPLRSEIDPAIVETMSAVAGAAIESARLYDQLAYRAGHDLLTGLANRATVETEIQKALAQARETGDPLAVLFLDLDRFKHINDSLGHRAGDVVLGQVAERVAQSLPAGAVLARVGGDEFTVLSQQQTNKALAEQLAIRILDALRVPIAFQGHELFASASIGISMFPVDGNDPADLLRHADLAMYRAKALGKNRYEFYSQDIAAPATSAVAVEHLLRRALDEGWFELYYQPQLNLAGELSGLEALLRLHHPEHGLIGPASFLAVAEEAGLMDRLGKWVLQQVCTQVSQWQLAGYRAVKVAVNIYALQFAQPSFAESVAQVLEETGVDPRLLELELTESMIMSDVDESARQMRQLRSLGVSIAVDDFGTGYSSLAYLHRLPIDILKIDQSFVEEMEWSDSTLPLVQAIVALAHNLGLAVVAEGVETNRQLAALRAIQCDYLQGFLFHRPQPASGIVETFWTTNHGNQAA